MVAYPQVQCFCFHLQKSDVGDIELVDLLLQSLNPRVGLAPLVLLVMSLGHQLSEEGNRRPPLPLLLG
jgi:hypothetical protein